MSEGDSIISDLQFCLAFGSQNSQKIWGNCPILKDAVTTGQKPVVALYGNGTIDLAGFFGKDPARAFCAGSFPLIIDTTSSPHSVCSIRAAATYAEHLGVKKHIMLVTSDGPLMSYLMGKQEIGPLMRPWMNLWNPILQKARSFANPNDPDHPNEEYHLAALTILSRNAGNLGRIVGMDNVTLCYLNKEQSLLEVYKNSNLNDMLHGRQGYTTELDLFKGAPKALACSCCDSRAGHGHLYCAQPGEFLDSNTIAAIIPPRKHVIQHSIPHPVWALAEYASNIGIHEAVVTGHSHCGGIHALVNWKAGGTPPNEYLQAWLGQASDVIADVFKFAKRNQFFRDSEGNIHPDVYKLLELCVTQWSARNLGEHFGETNVLGHYLDIETREVYVLNPHDDIEETYKQMKSMKKLSDLIIEASTSSNLWLPEASKRPHMTNSAWKLVTAEAA